MSRLRKTQPFYIVVIDEEQNKFNVLGPMLDDTEINHKVHKCQDSGRKVRCFSQDGQLTREEVINSVKTQQSSYYEFSIIPIVSDLP